MITRNGLIFNTALLLAIGQAASAGDLNLAANSPTVPVETRADGRNFIRLPALQYTVRVSIACAADANPARLSVNVADTRVLLNEDQVVAASTVDVPLLIPASQIGPIAVEDFCLTESAGIDDASETMTVPSVLSIQASLLCSGESGDEIDYASMALDVTLECVRPPDSNAGDAVSTTSREVLIEKSHSP